MVYTETPGKSVLDQIRFLRLAGFIDKPTSALLDDLRKIGNTARHDTAHQFSKDDAVRYRALVERLLQLFTEIAPHYKQGRPRGLPSPAGPAADRT